MSLVENLKDARQYLKPFAMIVGAFFGLIILGFVAASVLNISLDIIMLAVVIIAFVGILALAYFTIS